MNWNYRVGRTISETDVWEEYSIVEAYYEDGKTACFGRVDVLSSWESLEELKATYDLVKGAFDKPILELNNFKSGEQV